LEIRATNLACARGGRAIFRGLNFHVGAGEFLTVSGPNGAGKTSLLRVLAGFIPPLEGFAAISSEGRETQDGDERASFVGWLGHADGARSQLSAREVLSFFAGLYEQRGDLDRALREIGLEAAADLPCQYLSAGQKKLLALVRLKLCNRPLWLLDEPLGSLDEVGRKHVARLIGEHCALGGIAIAATHEPIAYQGANLRLVP
jgi:heme exporter protein A